MSEAKSGSRSEAANLFSDFYGAKFGLRIMGVKIGVASAAPARPASQKR
jgi:hypothetical protein